MVGAQEQRYWWLAVLAFAVVASACGQLPTPPSPPSPPTAGVPGSAGAATDAPATDDLTPMPAAAPIRHAVRLDDRHGWVTTEAGLLLTDDDGRTWRDATPVDATGDKLLGATFADPDRGWVATAVPDPNATTFKVWQTQDAGRTWAGATLPEGVNRGDLIGTGWFATTSVGRVYLLIEGGMPTGYTGDLFASDDGGRTWSPIPILVDAGVTGSIAFADRNHGVVAGGAPGDRMFVTDDAGRTWRRAAVPSQVGAGDGIVRFDAAPTFWTATTGGVPVVFGNTERATTVGILVTGDSGATWQPGGAIPTGPEGDVAAAALPDPSHWRIVTSHAGGATTDDAGLTWTPFAATGLPATPDEISMPDPQHAWVVVRMNGCNGLKTDCWTRSGVFATEDGAATWTLIWPRSG